MDKHNGIDAYKVEFATRFQRLINSLAFATQEELADFLEVDQSLISNWGNYTKNHLPSMKNLEVLRQKLGESFVRELLVLDGKNGNDYGLTWIESMPAGVNQAQAERIQRGIVFLRQMVQEGESLGTYCPGYQNETVRQAYGDYQFAAQCGSIRFLEVPQNTGLAKQVKAAYPNLLDVIVADIPETCDYDGTPIRADLVAHLAAQALFGDKGAARSGIVGWGSGYTLMRTAQLTANYGPLTNKTWLSTMAFPNESRVAYPANSVVNYLGSLHIGSLTHLMLDPQHPRAAEHLQQSVTGQLGTILLTVNGFGPDNRKGGENFQSLVDGYSRAWQGSPAWHYWTTLSNAQRKAVVGELLGTLFDADGQPIVAPDPTFMNTMDYRTLYGMSSGVWLVASMAFKAEAVRMAIRSGLARNLVIDSSIAWALLTA
jgi:hypothetical protein